MLVVIVMLIVGVLVHMRHRLVLMQVLVPLGDMQPDPHGHQRPGDCQFKCEWLSHGRHRDHRAGKWRGRKIRAGACRAQMAQGQHKQHQAETITDQPQPACRQHNRQRWQRRAKQQRDGRVDRASREPLGHGNERGIQQRHFARQVVVDCPE